MSVAKLNQILLTGDPGCGKTTLVHKVYKELLKSQVKVEGFYTEELRYKGQRIGFDVVLFNGTRAPLARLTSPNTIGPKVGRYTVDLKAFESLVLPLLSSHNIKSADLLIIDEIGKMELFSKAFETFVKSLFQSSHVILATVPNKGSYLVENLKAQAGTNLVRVNSSNRNGLVEDIKNKIRALIQLKA